MYHAVQPQPIHPSYADLPYIDNVRPWSATEDGDCFNDVADVLLDSHSEMRFAITLLHHHFVVHENEIMVSRFERDDILVTAALGVHDALSRCTVPSSWRLNSSGNKFELVPLEWIQTTEANALRLRLSTSDKETLSQLGRVLVRHGALNRFGFRLAEVLPVARKGMVIMETTYINDRMLELAPETEISADLGSSIQTTWQIKESSSPSNAEVFRKKRFTILYAAKCRSWCRKQVDFSHVPAHSRG